MCIPHMISIVYVLVEYMAHIQLLTSQDRYFSKHLSDISLWTLQQHFQQNVTALQFINKQ